MSVSPLKEGDVVWAHQRGYPWWPAVISISPANPNQGLWQVGGGKRTRYHCTFLAWNKERSWLDGTAFKRFKRKDGGDERKKEYIVKGRDYKDSHLEAIKLALQILDDPTNPMNYVERKMDELMDVVKDDNPIIDEIEVDSATEITPIKTSKAPIKKARQGLTRIKRRKQLSQELLN